MGGIRRGWYDRLEPKRITLDWVNTNVPKLTKRELLLLKIVDKHKLIRRDHLETIHPDFFSISNPISRTTSINRSISKLFRSCCIDKVHQHTDEGNLPCVLSLDRAGHLILNPSKPFKRYIKQTPKQLHDREILIRSLPANYPHVHGLNDLHANTLNFCREHNFKLVIWNIETTLNFMYSKMITFIPDIYCLLNINNLPLSIFIEYDTGSENIRYKNNFPTLLNKIKNYQKYKRSQNWKKDLIFSAYFPILLFITEDEKRLDYLNTKIREHSLLGIATIPSNYHRSLVHFINMLIETKKRDT